MVTSPLSDNPKTRTLPLPAISKDENTLTKAEEVILHSFKKANLSEFPSICLILGSGLGELADRIDSAVVIPYREIPGFPLSRVAGHAGNLVIGRLSNVPVIALAGRAHFYEGWTHEESTFPIKVLSRLGGKRLIASNASGGINPRFHSGQVILIDQHIDWLGRRGRSTATGKVDEGIGTTSITRSPRPIYDPEWNGIARELALKLGFALEQGTYLATTGPSYETRAEYRAFAKIGADMVGMSTVHEVLLANQLGMKCTAFSIVTNVATPDLPTKTDHSEVLDWSKRAQSQLIPLIERLVAASVEV